MQIGNLARAFQKALTTNNNDSAFASRIPTITEPVNDGVITLGGEVAERILVLPYGLGSDNDAFSLRVIGWRHIGPGVPQSIPLWVPVILGEFACICSTIVGVATAPVLNTERFCDTITPVAARLADRVIAAGTAVNSDCAILSPTGNAGIAALELKLKGYEKVEFTFDQTTGTPTMNCLISFF